MEIIFLEIIDWICKVKEFISSELFGILVSIDSLTKQGS